MDPKTVLHRYLQQGRDAMVWKLEGAAEYGTGRVPRWPAERAVVTLHHALVHVATETHRHAGHADIVRELVDGAAGLRPGATNLPEEGADDAAWWARHHERVDRAAREAAQRWS